jgi:hypothetical protein
VFPTAPSASRPSRAQPWPTWRFALPGVGELVQEILLPAGGSGTLVTWRLVDPKPDAHLIVRPLLSGRDYHSLHTRNGAFRFDGRVAPGRVVWRPYDGVPAIVAVHDGDYQPRPDWYRSFFYAREHERGLDDREDLASPGTLRFDLSSGRATSRSRSPTRARTRPARSPRTAGSATSLASRSRPSQRASVAPSGRGARAFRRDCTPRPTPISSSVRAAGR